MNVVVELFRELPDWLKLVVFLILLAFTILSWIVNYHQTREAKDLEKTLRRKQIELNDVVEERNQLQHRFEALDQIDSHVWTKPDLFQNDRFVQPERRTTRFIALCNLKGESSSPVLE